MRIAIKDIKLSPYQVRDLEDDPELEALSESIKEYGQLVPIAVRPNKPKPGGPYENLGYECIFGHRRLKASEMAGLETVEALVGWKTDEQVQILALIENTQRKDLEVIELAKALKALQYATGWSQKEMANRIGLPNQTISVTMALLNEPADIQEMVHLQRGKSIAPSDWALSREHVTVAREAVRESESRANVLRKAAKERLTVDQTRGLAKRYASAPTAELKARILEVPAKKQEALEVIREDLEKAEERAERIRPPMTVTDYWGKVQAVEQQIKKLVLAARQVEVWQSGTWPLIEGCFERIVSEIEGLLQEVESA